MGVVILLRIHRVNYVLRIKQDVNLNVFNMITGINESRTLLKHISCSFRCKYVGRKCNSN